MPSATTHAQTWTLAVVLCLGGKLAKAQKLCVLLQNSPSVLAFPADKTRGKQQR